MRRPQRPSASPQGVPAFRPQAPAPNAVLYAYTRAMEFCPSPRWDRWTAHRRISVSLLASRQKARDSLGDGVGPVEWEEVPTGIDDLNRTFAKLLVEGFGPARLEEGIVGSPGDQRRRLDLVDVLRPAGEISVVQRPRRAEVGAAAPQVLEGSGPLVDHLLGDPVRRRHPGFQALAESATKIDVDHDLVPRRLFQPG